MLSTLFSNAKLVKGLPSPAFKAVHMNAFRAMANFSNMNFSYHEIANSQERQVSVYDDDEHYVAPETTQEMTPIPTTQPQETEVPVEEVKNSTFDEEIL